MITVYGIKNCDTVKKAIVWLNAHQIGFEFHDYKQRGIDEQVLQRWSKQVGWEPLLNKRGTTWKKLSAYEQQVIDNAAEALRFMQSKPSAIRRPLIEREGRVIALGFSEQEYEAVFA
jgi:Spx/MgsR family transcriptional regulator